MNAAYQSTIGPTGKYINIILEQFKNELGNAFDASVDHQLAIVFINQLPSESRDEFIQLLMDWGYSYNFKNEM